MFDEAGYTVISIEGINASQDYWKSRTLLLLRQLFRKWMQDIPYQQFLIVATPRSALGAHSTVIT
jgi:hypothetical protein